MGASDTPRPAALQRILDETPRVVFVVSTWLEVGPTGFPAVLSKHDKTGAVVRVLIDALLRDAHIDAPTATDMRQGLAEAWPNLAGSELFVFELLGPGAHITVQKIVPEG